MRVRALLPAAILGGLAAINFGVGLGEDPDAYLVLQRALAFPEQGYTPSRTWGFPFYELIAYPLIAYGGERTAKVWSLVCMALAVVAFLAVLDRLTKDRTRALAGAIGFAVLPVTVVAATTVLETAQGALLAIVAWLAWLRWCGSDGRAAVAWWYACAAAIGLATATRPEYALLAAALAMASVRRALPARPHVLGGVALAAACAVLPYLLMYGGLPFTLAIVPPDPWPRRLVRAVFGLAALIGLPASILIGAWGAFARDRDRARDESRSDEAAAPWDERRRDLRWIAAAAGVLYFTRFVILPDELDYVFILAPLAIAVVVSSRMSTPMVWLFAVLLGVPNVVQVHLFMRTTTGTIAVAPGISAGAIAQERSARQRTRYVERELPAVRDRAAARFDMRGYAIDPAPDSDRPAIIPEDALRFYRADRRGGASRASAVRSRIVVYTLSTGRGWRQFLKPEVWRPVAIDDFREIDPRGLPR